MDERDEPVRHETTVINAGGDRGGGSGLLLGVILVLIIGVAAFLYFGGYLGRGDGNRDININANIRAPDINITPPSTPAPSTPPAGNGSK